MPASFEPTRGIAMEVEAGRATMGNAIYRDLIESSLMVDASFFVLAVPTEYRYKSGVERRRSPATRRPTPSSRRSTAALGSHFRLLVGY